MGRLFLTDLEGPVYTCKHCPDIDFAVYEPINRIQPDLEFPANLGKMYLFYKCVNVEIGTVEVIIHLQASDQPIIGRFYEVFCVVCGSHLGFYNKGTDDPMRYNEGYFFINRFKLHGPPELSDDENPEVGGN